MLVVLWLLGMVLAPVGAVFMRLFRFFFGSDPAPGPYPKRSNPFSTSTRPVRN
jgi:hypothetical protein